MASPFEMGACVYPPLFVSGLIPHEVTPLEESPLHVVDRVLQATPLHALTTTILIDGRRFVTCTSCQWTKELLKQDHAPAICAVESALLDWREECRRAFRSVERTITAGEREGGKLGAMLRELAS